MGLRVFTEIGKKKPVSPMKSDDAIKAVLEDLEAGSEHVILESAETKLLRENNMIDVLPTIAKAVGLEHIYFELRRGYNLEQPWMELCEWLVQSLGPEINVMNFRTSVESTPRKNNASGPSVRSSHLSSSQYCSVHPRTDFRSCTNW